MIRQARSATADDAEAIARIYNEGIADRVATGARHPIMVVEEAAEVLAFAATSDYRRRQCYAGVAGFSVYIARAARRWSAGRLAREALIHASAQAGFWKLLARISRTSPASGSAARSVSGWSAPARNTANWTVSGAAWRSWNGCFRNPRVV